MDGFKNAKWDDIKDSIISQWDKLNDGDVKHINGHSDKLVTTVKVKYSITQTEAQKQVQDFIDKKQPIAL